MEKHFILIEPDELQQLIKDVLNEVLDERVPVLPFDARDYYTSAEVAAKWQVSKTSLWRYAKLGLIHPIKVDRTVRYSKKEIDNTVNFELIDKERRKTKAEKNIKKSQKK